MRILKTIFLSIPSAFFALFSYSGQWSVLTHNFINPDDYESCLIITDKSIGCINSFLK